VLGDIASSGIGSLGISWESCPALTEVEEVTCEWMRQLTGLSEAWHGAIHDTAAKAVQMAGFGDENLRLVACDPTHHTMDPKALAEAIKTDRDAGRTPALVVASSGSTGVTAFDPVDAIAAITEDQGIWLHVDAAMAGSAMLLPECRHLWHGVERADSVAWNPHKWFGTLLDCALFYVRDPDLLVRVLSTNPSYLQSAADGQVTQYRDWGIPLGRRFRALKLWFHLALDGVESIQARLRRDLDNARWLADQVADHPEWELVAPLTLQTVSVRHRGAAGALSDDELDAHTLKWVGAINASGAAFLSPAQITDNAWSP